MLWIFALFLANWGLTVGFFYIGNKLSPGYSESRRRRGKLTLSFNLAGFTLIFLLSAVLIFTGQVYATGGGHSVNEAAAASDVALAAAFIGAGLVTGLGAIGTGIAVSSAAAAAIGAISENENNFGKAMIFVAMAEGIAIYGLLISFMILGRV